MQDIVDERLQIIKEYSMQGMLPVQDLYISINCIPVDCKDIKKCPCQESDGEDVYAHFEIPQIVNDYGVASISYLGSADKQFPFVVYTSPLDMKYHKHRKRGHKKPYVWIDTTPNENNMYDCFVFNAPFLKQVAITAIFKDLRQLENFSCCNESLNITFIDNEIKNRVTQKKIKYYRQLAHPVRPNDQQYQ